MLRICALLVSLVCMVTCSEEKPSQLVDYTLCSWTYGTEGEEVECHAGYVAVGACGSETMENCNGKSTGLYCCAVIGFEPQHDCEWMHGDLGEHMECVPHKLVHGECGSGGSDKCEGKTHAIQCCQSDARATRDNTCTWEYGGNGENKECGTGRVVAGRCASRNLTQCPSGTHGIYCCNVQDRLTERDADSTVMKNHH